MKEAFDPSQRILRRVCIIGPELIDGNKHVNNAKQHRLLEFERGCYINAVKEVRSKLGERPFISHVMGSYRKQMFQGDDVVIDTTAQIKDQGIEFHQTIARHREEKASDFYFTALNENKASKYPSNDVSALKKFTEEITVSPELVDVNGRLTVEGHLLMMEQGRVNYFDNLIMDTEKFHVQSGLMPVVARVNGDCAKPIYEGSTVRVDTAAEDKVAYILFTQIVSMMGEEVSRFKFTEALVGTDGFPRKVPELISFKLKSINGL